MKAPPNHPRAAPRENGATLVNDGPASLPPEPETVKEIFSDACELEPERRQEFLDQRCGGDGLLRAEVESLLRLHESGSRFLSDPPAAVERAGRLATANGAADELPRYVNHFKLVLLLGEGGFGAVYLAEQEHPVRRTVAVKIIKLGMDTKQVIARFEAERQALAMMDHPNIAKVLDAGATETGRPYFVMELVHGVPITEYCDANRLTIRQRLELFIPVCLAVGHAHQKGVIHRDIKPSNVLVERYDPGAPPVPKVIDFGIAKATAASLTDGTRSTGMRQLIGTLEYMSPEQADLCDPAVDTRSDIYSLGALLYELLTGAAPFDGDTLRNKGYSEAQRIIREVQPPRPSSRVTTIGAGSQVVSAPRGRTHEGLARLLRGDLDRVVMKCLEKDRERRYSSAAALAEDVRRYLDGQPMSAGPATATYRLRKFVLRHTTAVAAIIGIALALVVAVVGTTTGLVRARSAQRTAIERGNVARLAQQRAEQNAAEARREARRALTISSFLRDIFALAQPESGAGGQEANVDEVLRRAAAEIDTKLRGQPEEELLARRMLGEACGRIFLHDLAVEQLRRAHELSVALPGGATSVRSLDLATEWAMAMYLASRGNEAVALARSTLAACRQILGDGHPVTWEAMHACALCVSQTRNTDECYHLLMQLVELARKFPEGRRADRLGRYLCNWAVCLRDRGQYEAASAALREAAGVIQRDSFDPAARVPPTAGTDEFPGTWLRLLGERSMDMLNASSWISKQMVEGGDFPEALPLVQRYIAEALRVVPQGTPAIAYRLEDEAMLQLRAGDRLAAGLTLARAIDMSRKLLGYDGADPQGRWRTWTMYCDPNLTQGWRSPALRNQVWCALDDLLRDNPPGHLVPEEVPLARLQFKLFRWNDSPHEQNGHLIAAGGLEELKALPEPTPGVYLLGLEVPRLGDALLRRANWLLLAPWSLEFRPIPRFDDIRTEPSGHGQNWTAASFIYDRRQMLGLALHDGLALTTENPRRLHWFTAVANTRIELPAGRYRFSISSDDGVRLWIDGRCVIDYWISRPSRTDDALVELAGGVHDLRVDFFQEVAGYALWLQAAPMTATARAAASKLGGGVPAVDCLVQLASQAAREGPHAPWHRFTRAGALARGGRFRDAESEYAHLSEIDPTDHFYWYLRTLLLAYLSDDAEYRRACDGMLDRFCSGADPLTLVRLLIACSLRPQPPEALERLRQLVDRADSTNLLKPQDPFSEFLAGMARYRIGQFERSAELLRRHLARVPQGPATSRAAAELFLAMAQHGLGNEADASAALARAGQLLKTQVPLAGVDDLGPNSFDVELWLICQTAWREANVLLGS